MLKTNGERGHPCPVPDLSGKVSSFSPLECDVGSRFFELGGSLCLVC